MSAIITSQSYLEGNREKSQGMFTLQRNIYTLSNPGHLSYLRRKIIGCQNYYVACFDHVNINYPI